ncbi:MAG: cyclic nucleotide-gated ion channel [Rhizomicrobium sp.]
MAKMPLRRKLYLILEGGHVGGPIGMIVEVGLILLILLNVVGFTLESVPSIDKPYWLDLKLFEAISVLIFTIEYVLRLWVSVEDPILQQKGPWRGRFAAATKPTMVIDFLAVAPVYFSLLLPVLDLRFLRMIRLLRLLKIARYSPALSTLGEVIVTERRALFGTLLVLACATIFAAAAMHAAEGAVQPDKFGSIPAAMWWAITTLTTVGYGDEVPITLLGRLVAGFTMVTGMGILALPVGIVATGFIDAIHRRDFIITFGMLARVPLFRDFDAAFLSEVMNLLRAQTVSRGGIIAVRGSISGTLYFIVSGDVELQFSHRALRMHHGDFFGELSLLHHTQHKATIVALDQTRLLALSAEDFTMLVHKYPDLKFRVEEAAAKHAKAFNADA